MGPDGIVIEGRSAAELTANLAAQATTSGLKASAPVPGTLMLSRRYVDRRAFIVGLVVIALGLGAGAAELPVVAWGLFIAGVATMVLLRANETVSLVVVDAPEGARVTASGAATGKLAAFVDAIAA